jgi:hypothetical protein
MQQRVFLAAFLSLAMSFLGTALAIQILIPAAANAQQEPMTVTSLRVVRPDSLPGMTAGLTPTGGGLLQILGADGQTMRAQLGAGGTANCAPGDTSCQEGGNAGLDVRHPDGNLAVRLGMLAAPFALAPPLAPGIRLVDTEGNIRYQASLDRDGNPTVQLFDADGRVIWSAP